MSVYTLNLPEIFNTLVLPAWCYDEIEFISEFLNLIGQSLEDLLDISNQLVEAITAVGESCANDTMGQSSSPYEYGRKLYKQRHRKDEHLGTYGYFRAVQKNLPYQRRIY